MTLVAVAAPAEEPNEKIQKIISFVETLTVAELVDFCKILEVHFKLKEEKKETP